MKGAIKARVQSARTEELLGERGNGDKRAVRIEELDSIIRKTLVLAKREAAAQARKAAAEAESIYGITSFAVADVLVANTRVQSNPLTILSETVAGFEEGGFVASFEGYFDNTHVSRSFADISMTINGAPSGRVRIGSAISEPSMGIKGMSAFAISGVFNTPNVAPVITVSAYAFNADDETTAAAGFYIRSGRLIISGAQ